MNPRRRWLALALSAGMGSLAVRPAAALTPRPLRFPADHGAHPDTRTEWWYVTGWLRPAGAPADAAPSHGFQVTFFRSRTGVRADHPSAFAATQLLMGHAALSDLAAHRLRHDERIARAGLGWASAATDDARIHLQDWSLQRRAADGAWRADVRSDTAGFALALTLEPTQPELLQGEAGWSRKGPLPQQASQYVSLPHLAATATLQQDGTSGSFTGRAWLDHEWSDEILPAQAVGWDWLGLNLDDGSALTLFRLRRADGQALHAGGSWRAPGQATPRNFAAHEVVFEPGRTWTSAATGAIYPVAWTVRTPVGTWQVSAAFEAQELDARASTGTVYWEGLCELRDATGRRMGRGYLEMTGYAGRLRL